MSIGAALLPLLAGVLAIPEDDGQVMRDLARRGDLSGDLVVELLVAPDHAIEGCNVLAGASGQRARTICDRAQRMKIAKTATDDEGTPVYGFVYGARFTRASSQPVSPPRYPIDMEIGVREIPGRASRKTITVTVLADETGSVSQCQADDDDDPCVCEGRQPAGQHICAAHRA